MRAIDSAGRLAPGEQPPLCVAGRNCWRVAPASRVAFLIDGDAYFRAFMEAVARAEESVLVIGWDVQAATRLQPQGTPEGWPPTLREFLNAVLVRRPELRIHVLDWDFSLVFALERELLPMVQLGWRTHRRLTFRLDGEHPLAACHHQKIVVVDDAVAFVGGFDLTTNRWDTPAHVADDPRCRLGPDDTPYAPFHDVQVAVSGEPARLLGVLARERWWRATGERPHAPSRRTDPWPPGLAADVTDAHVAIARTEPAFDGRPPVHEVAALYLDAIAAAARSLYVENQYLTSPVIADALAARLAEPDGPDIVLVLPLTCPGWLEETTMGVLRARVLRRLRDADRHGHLRIYHPRLPGSGVGLNVHAKVMVVDDALARIASSNLSSRSLGLDTECDVAIESRGEPRVAAAIAGLRDRLLGEHLDVPPAAVAAALASTGSLVRAIERLRGRPRTLEPLREEPSPPLIDALPPLADLERPVSHAPFLRLLPVELREPILHTAVRVWGPLVGAAVLAILWVRTGVGGWFPLSARLHQLAPAAVVCTYLTGSALLVPVTVLIMLTLLVFGPWPGALWALTASLAAAAVGYGAGRLVLRERLERLAGQHVARIARRLGRGSTWAVVTTRMLPVAPFTVVNLVAGALRVSFVRFLLGTAFGMAPGIAVLAAVAALFASR